MDALLAHCGPFTATYLLFLFLHAVETAAQCPTPQRGENTILSNTAILMNDFPEGTTVTLECANGYEKDSGSGNISCMDGTWTEPDLQCKKKDCGPPRRQPHMSFDISGGTLFASVIKVICDEGYQITGSSYKQCYSTGWFGRAKCAPIKCEKPAEVTNGRNSWMSEHNPTYNDTIEYSCNEGYSLNGQGRITCSKTGQYDFQPPECISVTTVEIFTSQIITTTTTSTTPTPTTAQTQEASSSTDATSPREETVPTSAVLHLGRGTETEESTEAADTNKNTGRTMFFSILVSGLIIGLVIGVFTLRSLIKRKGSYDTREDLKPELLQFQNI